MTDSSHNASATQAPGEGTLDALVIGAGLAGLYAAHRLHGLGLKLQIIEAGDGVGGTWYWNRYPGARCDITCLEYSYSFSEELQQEWEWTERYAAQPEVLRYINHVADRFDLRRHIRFRTRVTDAVFDEDRARWKVTLDDGSTIEAKYLVSAVGTLSASKDPEIPGIDTFEGAIYRTSAWPHEDVDLSGLRVAVIGTGSSGIQTVTAIAPVVKSLTVFQRTPNFSVPARNRLFGKEELAEYKSKYPEYRQQAREDRVGVLVERATKRALEVTDEERKAVFDARWDEGRFYSLVGSFSDLLTDIEANDTVADYVRSRIAEIVEDPQTREDLLPRGYAFGTKRVCMDTGYFETFNRPNVKLVNLKREPFEEMTPKGIRTTQGEYEFDAIIFATGFDAFTGPLTRMNIRGRDGRKLGDDWQNGPRAYLGLASAGFPNLFMITGPGSPSVVSNMVVSIEQHGDWISSCIKDLEEWGIASIEATREAEEEWVRHSAEVANATLYPTAPSYMMGANVPGKARVFLPYLGGVPRYREKLESVAANDYEGFTLVPERTRESAEA